MSMSQHDEKDFWVDLNISRRHPAICTLLKIHQTPECQHKALSPLWIPGAVLPEFSLHLWLSKLKGGVGSVFLHPVNPTLILAQKAPLRCSIMPNANQICPEQWSDHWLIHRDKAFLETRARKRPSSHPNRTLTWLYSSIRYSCSGVHLSKTGSRTEYGTPPTSKIAVENQR